MCCVRAGSLEDNLSLRPVVVLLWVLFFAAGLTTVVLLRFCCDYWSGIRLDPAETETFISDTIRFSKFRSQGANGKRDPLRWAFKR